MSHNLNIILIILLAKAIKRVEKMSRKN